MNKDKKKRMSLKELLNTPIATKNEIDPAFQHLHGLTKMAIMRHQRAHQKGRGEFMANLEELFYLIPDIITLVKSKWFKK